MANSSDSAVAVRRLGSAAYYVAFLLVVISLFDYAGTVWPFQLDKVEWRYGAVGLLSSFLLTPMLGVLLAMLTAALADHSRTLKTLAILNLLGGIASLVMLLGFTLDAIQMYQLAKPELKPLTELSSAKAAVKLLTATIAWVWLGIAGFRRGHAVRERERSDPRESRVLG